MSQSNCEWKECKLGDVINFGNGKVRPKTEGLIPVYGGNGVMDYCDDSNYDGETIIIGRVGAYCGSVFYKNGSIWVSDNALAAKPKNNNNAKYLFYFLKEIKLNQLAEGSSHPLITQTLLNSIDVMIPEDANEQKAIASVLSSLDDKIDLLHRQNKTLEVMAETLFRQWFASPELVKGEEAGEGWEEKPLGDYVSVVDNRGKTPPNTEIPTPYPVIEVNALGERLVNYSVIRKYVDEKTYTSWFRNELQKFDTLISTVGSIGAISMFIIESGNIAQNVVGFHPKDVSPFFIYQILKYKADELTQLDIGGVQPSIKVPHLLSMLIPVPPKEIQNKFDDQVKCFVEKMENNYKQIRTLEKLRDNLLPKLMSGEVRVLNHD
ncbi:MAG TPA: restriction endonuclease subunit S [bacterium]|nr:restriction endonuclease subunit S [bacterium]HQM84241.1 restriction endonuclease subunit S [bacterium]